MGQEYKCETCGEVFDSHYALNGHKTTHSQKHRKAMNNKGTRTITKRCEECGEEFKIKKYRENTVRFCSRECKAKWESKNLSGKDSHRWKEKGDVKCDYCGKKFHKRIVEIKSHNFCSKECFYRWKSENPKTPIKNLPDAKNMRGEKNPRWKGGREPYYGSNWLKQRRKVLERDNYKCQRCGVERENLNRDLSVHHIKPLKSFKDDEGNIDFEKANELSNLISLCPSCHKKVENLPLAIDH